MTLEEKVGQMTQIDWKLAKNTDDVRKLHVGSVLNGATSLPEPEHTLRTGQACCFYADPRLGTPPSIRITGADGSTECLGEGRHRISAHIGACCTRQPRAGREGGKGRSPEILATGIPWTFAPCIAVPRDERWGRTYEGMARRPSWPRRWLRPWSRACRAGAAGAKPGVLACAKHCRRRRAPPGARTRATPSVPSKELRAIHLPATPRRSRRVSVQSWCRFSRWNGPHARQQAPHHDVLKATWLEGFVVSGLGSQSTPCLVRTIAKIGGSHQCRRRHGHGR